MSQYDDLYGSNARRAAQERRDAIDWAKPYVPQGGYEHVHTLRTVEERLARIQENGAIDPGKRFRPVRVARRARLRRRGY